MTTLDYPKSYIVRVQNWQGWQESNLRGAGFGVRPTSTRSPLLCQCVGQLRFISFMAELAGVTRRGWYWVRDSNPFIPLHRRTAHCHRAYPALVGDQRIRTLISALKTPITTLESPVLEEPAGIDPASPV